MSFINKIIDVVVLSMVWAVCCIPVITIGPASAALYYAITKAVRRQRSYAVKEFFRAFKSNFKKGVIAGIIWIIFTIMMLWTDVPLILTMFNTQKVQDTFLLVLLIIKAFILIGMACWIYPLMSRFEQKLWRLAQVSLYLLVRHFPITLFCGCIFLLTVFLLALEPLLAAVVPGAAVLLQSFVMEPVLKKICEPENDNPNIDRWYLE